MTRSLLTILLAAACTTESHVATTTSSESSGDGDGELSAWISDPASWPSGPPASCGGPDQEPAVTWEGWIEAFSFREGSDRIRVFVEPDGAGGWSGYFIPGEGPHFDVAPRDANDCRFLCSDPWVEELVVDSYIEEGFRYTLLNVTYTENRLRFDIDQMQVFEPWCRLQTPTAGRPHSCLPSVVALTNPYSHDDCFLLPEEEDPIQIPCCKYTLCQGICECTADGCTAGPSPRTFDLLVEGDSASGTTPFGTGHLERL